ncbi:CpsD/CapB family tyrosine-protein kinase [Humitalea sp. 24SJ18S-53]|uniref:CpsD/CapB family tyrosine-protein kinase n=1 Tax=Humitalea sp. 24SJ18S-53 TaxID=3422307 RepID=UPI003D67EC90
MPLTPTPRKLPVLEESALMSLAVGIATGAHTRAPFVALVASHPREGTTTVAVNLARTLESGLRRSVAVIDANFAAPGLATAYGLPAEPGLFEVLRGDVPLRRALHVAVSGQFAVLPAGAGTAADQGGLFAAGGIVGLCQQIRREGFEFCLVDCPAVLAYPEAAVLAGQSGAAFMVLRAEHTRWDAMRESVAILQAGGAPLRGTVLNRYQRHLPRFLDRLL